MTHATQSRRRSASHGPRQPVPTYGIASRRALVCVVLLALAAPAAAQMPDASLMHGRAIPASELPAGTVTVRVVREAVGNDLPGQQVRVTAGGTTVTATTDEQGRAEFASLPRGAEARAETVVDGERLVSQPFAVPTSGGLRVILVAGLTAAPEMPPVPGTVVLGGDSRVIVQVQEDALDVYYVLDIVNSGRAPIDAGGPVVIDLPRGAGGATLLEGSSPLAIVSGDRVTVPGPFAPGTTPVGVGYRLRSDGQSMTVRQAWPAAFQRVLVVVEKLGDLGVSSPQFERAEDLRNASGQQFVMGTGPALAAGAPLEIALSNLPFHSRTPRYVALGLAGGLVLLGVWLGVGGGRAAYETETATLIARREALLTEGARLEAQRRSGAIERGRYERRRQRLIAELEEIYARFDDAQAGAPGGGAGLAA